MKLDRNTNRGGRGKYALVNMRKLIPIIELGSKCGSCVRLEDRADLNAFNRLVSRGIITLGNETPGDQFFVMKYKDKFTADGLRAYAMSVARELKREDLTTKERSELSEFCAQMSDEANEAQKLGNRIPD